MSINSLYPHRVPAEGLAQQPRPVLHVARPAAGGLRRHLVVLLSGLSAEGVGCALAGPEALLNGLRPDLPENVALKALEVTDAPSLATDLAAARRLRGICRGTGPSLLHAHGMRAGWVAALSGSGIPLVLTAHNLLSPPRSVTTRLLVRWALRRTARVIAVSDAVRLSAIAAGAPPARVTVVPNGILLPPPVPVEKPEALRQRLGMEAETPVVLCAARLMADKGVDVLVRAWPDVRLRVPDARLVIVGDGPDRQALEVQSAITSGILFVGASDDLPAFYALADCIAIPSRREGQSLVCLEAMAAEHPPAVVAAAAGGLAEMVQGGQTGLLVPPEDPGTLAHAVAALLSDPALRQRLTANAADMVARRYTAQQMV